MRSKCALIAFLALGASPIFAQEMNLPVNLGIKVGVPVTDMFSANNTTEFSDTLPGAYAGKVPRYELGVSGEFHLPFGLRFEADALIKRGGYESNLPFGTGLLYRKTTFNQFEFPGLIKKNLAMGHYRPFVEVGASLRHITGIAQTTDKIGPLPILSNNALELRNRNSVGGVAGFGITFKKGIFELTPEARYTRWANQAFTSAAGLRTNLDQGDVLLGISF